MIEKPVRGDDGELLPKRLGEGSLSSLLLFSTGGIID